MASASDIIARALRINNVLASGETATSDEQADGLTALNAMLSGWQTNKLNVYSMVEDTHTLVVGTASYTIGTGATISTDRPERIEHAYTRESGNLDYPLDIINSDSYESIIQKDLQSRPEVLYYNPEYPLGKIFLYPTPSTASTLVITSWTQLQSFATIATAVSLPSGYEDAMAYNLALRIAPEYGIPLRQGIKFLADETLGNIRRANTGKPRYANTEVGNIGGKTTRFNINKGY